jgi:hypothetical protein
MGECTVKVTCAVSGLTLDIAGLEGIAVSSNAGYYHPIFTLDSKTLYKLYYQHSRNKLTPTDSYLLFLAFLQQTNQITWQAPATCKPNEPRTIKLVQNNLAQLISVSEKSAIIKHPSFKQPSFIVSYDNGTLDQVTNWIEAWQENIIKFNVTRATYSQQRDLARIEATLNDALGQGVPLEELPAIVGSWAAQAAEFPVDKDEQYQRVIRSCFNSSKMFNTPLALIKEVQEFCYTNIDAGSIYFHTLCEILKEGASRHVDYLGGSPLALGYTLLDIKATAGKEGEAKTAAELSTIVSKAPQEEPDRNDYTTSLDFLKAKLAYRVATSFNKTTDSNDGLNL